MLWELYENLPRQAPGDDNSTAMAMSLIPSLISHPKIIDIGCGSGAQTLVLAKLSQGEIIAVDIHPPFLDILNNQAAKAGLLPRIKTLECSMFDLDFPSESFDLIWSEGAIYIMGFLEGLSTWKAFLKPQGFIAVTELSWLVNNPPETPLGYWQENYPPMKTIEDNIKIIKGLGYKYIDSFILPKTAWLDNYYTPLAARILELKTKYQDNPEAISELAETELEIDIYHQYGDYYGYVFYIMAK